MNQTAPVSRRGRGARVSGYVLIFLILGGYFAWMLMEMGSHAASGHLETGAIFGAIFLGVVALLAGGAAMRGRS